MKVYPANLTYSVTICFCFMALIAARAALNVSSFESCFDDTELSVAAAGLVKAIGLTEGAVGI